MKLSLLVMATALACGNATSNEPATNAATQSQSQTQTTGATLPHGSTRSGDYNQTNVGKGMPASGDRAVSEPPSKPIPTVETPRAPAPPTTGDPPPTERR